MVATTQSFSIARRSLDVEDYIDIGRRHVGWIAGPMFAGVVVSIVVAFMLPNQYQSRATMQITPAQISDTLVQSTISMQLNEKLQQMTQNILSRSSLSSIINDPKLNLYREEIKTAPLEDVIDQMKQNIGIIPVQVAGATGKRASAFDITFTYKDRYKAREVVMSLINKFDEENQSTQKTQQEAVKGFVGDELNSAKADLNEANNALTTFRETNAGKLPDSIQVNMALEANLTAKITAVNDEIARDKQQLETLEATKATQKGRLDFFTELGEQAAALGAPGSPEAKQNAEVALLEKVIDQEQSNLELYHKQYSDSYPPVKGMNAQLEQNKKKLADLNKKLADKAAADAANKPTEPAKKTMSVAEREARQGVKEQLDLIDVREKQINDEIKRLADEETDYKKKSDEVHSMLTATTGLEAQYEDLKRAQLMADQNYANLQKDQHLAEANSHLISRGAGETLEILDSANLPLSPTSPKRPLIIGAGFALSILLGLMFAATQEAKDTSLKNLKDVRAYTNLPVLCSIPLLENTMLVKRKRRLAYLAWSAAVLVGAAAVTGAVVFYETITMKG